MVLSMPQFVISLCIGLFVLMLIIFPSFRAQLKVLLGGFLQVFVQDKAKTPEGAKAIYTSAIEEKQNKYNDICNIVNNLAGKLESLKAEFNKNKKLCEDADSKARMAISRSDEESARTWAQTRQEALDMCNNLSPYIKKVENNLEDAKRIKEQIGNELAKLKRESKNVVTQMELSESMTDYYSKMDDLRADTALDKLLDATRDGAQEKNERAVGAKVNFETSRKGRQIAAKSKASDYDVEAYLASIKEPGKLPVSNKTNIKK